MSTTPPPVSFRAGRLGLAALALLAGCANPERSRDWSDPQVAGSVLAQQVCANCHGADGQSLNTMFPNLAGQQKEYIVAQLEALQARDRDSLHSRQFMWGPSRYLTARQRDQIGDYFSSLPPMHAKTPVGAPLARGEALFRHGAPAADVQACVECHGDQGQGDGATPRLAGQHVYYLVHRARIAMTEVVAKLSDDDIAAVSAYVASLNTPGPKPGAGGMVPAANAAPPSTNCAYSVWTNGWYCGSWWQAFVSSLKDQ